LEESSHLILILEATCLCHIGEFSKFFVEIVIFLLQFLPRFCIIKIVFILLLGGIFLSLLQKQDLTTEELQLLSSEMSKKQKSSGTTWLLWFFTSVFGGHRFYLGKTGTAVAMLLTFGGLGFWAFIDLFLINGMVRNTNDMIESEIIEEIRVIKRAKRNSQVAVTVE
jgi:TM2 domain-containing membrane protein YozV